MHVKGCFLAVLLVLVGTEAARGWHNAGHHKATMAAVAATKGALPAFFTANAASIAHSALDPDAFTRPIAPSALHHAESPEHYFDFEVLALECFPGYRYEFLALCAESGVDPTKVGLLPYAVTEATEKLTVAFAEHRKWPDNPHIRNKSLVYAGLLSHYAQDLTQPLHVTIHWDGRAKEDFSSPRTGIHLKVDALPGKLDITTEQIIKGIEAKPFDELFRSVMSEIHRTHALVEKVYALEANLPGMSEPIEGGSDVEKLAIERLRAAAAFTASLYLTAWKDSERIEIPEWHKREAASTRPASEAPTTRPLEPTTKQTLSR